MRNDSPGLFPDLSVLRMILIESRNRSNFLYLNKKKKKTARQNYKFIM